MAEVDKGGLRYSIEVRDAFSAVTQKFQAELAAATAAFERFRGAAAGNAAAAGNSAAALNRLATAVQKNAEATAEQAHKSKEVITAAEAQEAAEKKLIAVINKRAVETRLQQIADDRGIELARKKLGILSEQETAEKRLQDIARRSREDAIFEQRAAEQGIQTAKARLAALADERDLRRQAAADAKVAAKEAANAERSVLATVRDAESRRARGILPGVRDADLGRSQNANIAQGQAIEVEARNKALRIAKEQLEAQKRLTAEARKTAEEVRRQNEFEAFRARVLRDRANRGILAGVRDADIGNGRTRSANAAEFQAIREDAARTARANAERDRQRQPGELERLANLVGRAILVTEILRAARAIETTFKAAVQQAIDYNAKIEQAVIGVAGLFTAVGEVSDAQGRALDGAKAFAAAQGLARDQVQKLRQDALATTVSFENLSEAFQNAIAPGLRAGLNVDEIRKFSVQIAQAGSAIGLQQNQLAEEIRSILQGTIQARTTRVATALGISNEDIRRAKEAGTLAEFLQKRFASFAETGKVAFGSFDATINRLKATFAELVGVGAVEQFEELKKLAKDVVDIITKQDINGFFSPSPDALRLIQTVSGGLRSIIAEGRRVIRGPILEDLQLFAELFNTVVSNGTKVTFALIEGLTRGLGDIVSIGKVIGAVFGQLTGFEIGKDLPATIANLTEIGIVLAAVKASVTAILALFGGLTALVGGPLAAGLAALALGAGAFYGLLKKSVDEATGLNTKFSTLVELVRVGLVFAIERATLAIKEFAGELATIATAGVFDLRVDKDELKKDLDDIGTRALIAGTKALATNDIAPSLSESLSQSLTSVKTFLSTSLGLGLEGVAKDADLTRGSFAPLPGIIRAFSDGVALSAEGTKKLADESRKARAELEAVNRAGPFDGAGGSTSLNRLQRSLELREQFDDLLKRNQGEQKANLEELTALEQRREAAVRKVVEAEQAASKARKDAVTKAQAAARDELNAEIARNQTAAGVTAELLARATKRRDEAFSRGLGRRESASADDVVSLEREIERLSVEFNQLTEKGRQIAESFKDANTNTLNFNGALEQAKALVVEQLALQDDLAAKRQAVATAEDAVRSASARGAGVALEIAQAALVQAKAEESFADQALRVQDLRVAALRTSKELGGAGAEILTQAYNLVQVEGQITVAKREQADILAKQQDAERAINAILDARLVAQDRLNARRLDAATRSIGTPKGAEQAGLENASASGFFGNALEGRIGELDAARRLADVQKQAAFNDAARSDANAKAAQNFDEALRNQTEVLATQGDITAAVERTTAAQENLAAVQRNNTAERRKDVDAIKDSTNALQKASQLTKTLTTITSGVIDRFAAGISDAIVDAFDPTKKVDLKERFGQFLRDISKLIISELVKIAVTKAVIGAVTFAGFGAAEGGSIPDRAPASPAHFAPGVRGMAFGGRPRGLDPRDTVPIWAAPGEFMMRAAAVAKYGEGVMGAINAGLVDPTGLAALVGTTGPAARPRGPGRAAGGILTTADAAAQAGTARGPAAAVVVGDQQTLGRLLAGGDAEMIRYMGQNAARINAALGRRA